MTGTSPAILERACRRRALTPFLSEGAIGKQKCPKGHPRENLALLSEMCYGRCQSPRLGFSASTELSFTVARVEANTIDFQPRRVVLARSRCRASVLVMVHFQEMLHV